MKPNYIKPEFKKEFNPKIGLITLSTDLTMESDFYSIINNLPIDVFVNRIKNYNPLTKENLLKMYDQLESVTKDILPNEKINTIAYGCTSGTIAIGKEKIKEKIQIAKPGCYITTPITSAIKAINKMKIKKIAIFTPYPDSVNKSVFEYFSKEKIEVLSFSSFNLDSDLEIGKVDPNYLLEVLTKMETSSAEGLFVSCTALPVLKILDQVETKIKKTVLSSNQTLIWDSIRSVGYNSPVSGYGKLFRN
jgi:maleate isomerase